MELSCPVCETAVELRDKVVGDQLECEECGVDLLVADNGEGLILEVFDDEDLEEDEDQTSLGDLEEDDDEDDT